MWLALDHLAPPLFEGRAVEPEGVAGPLSRPHRHGLRPGLLVLLSEVGPHHLHFLLQLRAVQYTPIGVDHDERYRVAVERQLVAVGPRREGLVAVIAGLDLRLDLRPLRLSRPSLPGL